jgi:predicted PurR-regulated permease PerM
MLDTSPSPLRFLHTAACIVIVLWAIKAAAEIIWPVLIALLIAYCILPFPNWLLRRFKLRKSLVLVLTAFFMIGLHVVLGLMFVLTLGRMKERLPLYHEHLKGAEAQFASFLTSLGLDASKIIPPELFSSDQILRLAHIVLPEALNLLSNRALIALLTIILVIELVQEEGEKRSAAGQRLALFSGDIRRYIGIQAQTGGINALANLVLLVALGVDFPLLWCVLYFFLNFVPTLGFIIALVPPTFLAFLMHGWERGLMVAVGLILTNTIVDNFVTPRFMQQGMDISFLELTLSLLFWGFLLGLPGGILAVPLTLVLKKVVRSFAGSEDLSSAPSG